MPAAGRTGGRWTVIAAICAVAFCCRAIVLWQLHDHPLLQPEGVLDDAVYVRLAQRVAGGDWGIGPEVYYLSPFYTYFAGLVFAVSGGSLLALRVVQIVLGTAAVWLVYATAEEWFGRRAAALAGAACALTGLFAFYEILLLQSAVDPFLTALALYALTRAVGVPGVWWPVATGVALGMLSLNRPNALPFVLVAGLGMLAVERSRRGVGRAGALVLAAALTIAPATLRNLVVAGEWVLISSHGGLNFYIGNNESADGTYTFVEGVTPSIEGQLHDTRAIAEKALGRPLSSSEVSAYFYDRALGWMRAQPGAAARLFVQKAWYVFNGADLALNYSYGYFGRDEPTILPLLFVGPWMIIPLGLVGLLVAWPRERRWDFAVLAAFVPVYAVSVAAFFVSTRYRLPLLIPLTVTAGGAAVWLADRVRAGDVKRLSWAAVAVLLLGVVVNWSLGPDTGRVNQQTEMALDFVRKGNIAGAERLLAKIAPLHPHPGLLNFRVGQAYFGRGDDVRAIAWLERARAIDPAEPNILLVLGQALVRSGRFAEAIPHLVAARDAGVSPEDAGLALAGALAELGRGREAQAALQRAVSVSGPELAATKWLAMGLMAMRLEDPALGERLFRQAIEKAPGLAVAHENLGLALLLQERADEALPELARSVELDGTSPSGRYNLAVALARTGRLTEARLHAQAALQVKPDYYQALEMIKQIDATSR